METYALFALMYAIVFGCYNSFRKKAEETSREEVILMLYTFVAFLCALFWLPLGVAVPTKFVFLLALRGLALSVGWLIILKVLKRVNVSLVSLISILSSVITFFVGIFFFKERITLIQFLGVVFIVVGAIAINFVSKNKKERANKKDIVLLVISAILTAVSNIIDKVSSEYMTKHQIQFWFLLFVFLFSFIFFVFKCFKDKTIIISKHDFKNVWIYLSGIILFIAEMFLFIAYSLQNSQMIIITTIGKFKVVVSVVISIFMFKEKHIVKKLILTLFMFSGIILLTI